jgi:putative flippase GtrA
MSASESATEQPGRPGLLVGLYRRFQHLIHEVAKFGVVGAVGFIVDWGVFNLCAIGFGLGPLTSKTISTTVSATLAFAGNRFWTWRHRPRTNLGREYFLFVVMNAVGLLISLLFLGFSHYVLGDMADDLPDQARRQHLGPVHRYRVRDAVPLLVVPPLGVPAPGRPAGRPGHRPAGAGGSRQLTVGWQFPRESPRIGSCRAFPAKIEP